MANGNRTDGNARSQTLLIVLIVVAVLYFARTIFIPLALAILLTFMLAPLVIRLRHWGVGRIPAAAIVVLVAFAIVAVITSVMASQLIDLAHKLPEYRHNVQEKWESIRSSGGGFVKRISGTVQKLSDDLTPPPPTASTQQPEDRPVPVEIRRTPFAPMDTVQKILGSVVSVVVTAGIVIVFVIFMLIERDELRDRLIRLVGSRQINLTTNVLDDAAHRVSRYLLAQFVINASYGAITGAALYFIHIPNPLLWAMFSGLLRYIPYLGIWFAAIMPALVALAVRPGWVEVPTIFGVYLGVDLLMYNFVEPVLYGSSTGLSALAVLVAAVFWTWLWGPAGLLLATPLTVCVVVIGRHVPRLSFLQVLLSDEPVLSPETRLYQRMLAMDFEEATLLAEEFLKTRSLAELFDDLIVPALSMAEGDRHGGKIDEAKEQFIFQNTKMLVEDMAERADELLAAENGVKSNDDHKDEAKIILEPTGPVEVMCIPARDAADELASFMLKLLLQKRGVWAQSLTDITSPAGVLEEVRRSRPKVACVTAVPPFANMHNRYLRRRLHAEFKDLKLAIALLREANPEEAKPTQGPPSAGETVTTLQMAVDKVIALAQPQNRELTSSVVNS